MTQDDVRLGVLRALAAAAQAFSHSLTGWLEDRDDGDAPEPAAEPTEKASLPASEPSEARPEPEAEPAPESEPESEPDPEPTPEPAPEPEPAAEPARRAAVRTRRGWAPAEEALLRDVYPLHGAAAAREALLAAGFAERTEGAVYKRAHVLKLARVSAEREAVTSGEVDTTAATAASRVAWTEDEERIITETYPLHGVSATRQALVNAGYIERTERAIGLHANRLGVRARGEGLRRSAMADAVLTLIRDYRGMPLSLADLVEELGYPHRVLTSMLLPPLLEEGVIANKDGVGGGGNRLRDGLFYDPHAERDAA